MTFFQKNFGTSWDFHKYEEKFFLNPYPSSLPMIFFGLAHVCQRILLV